MVDARALRVHVPLDQAARVGRHLRCGLRGAGTSVGVGPFEAERPDAPPRRPGAVLRIDVSEGVFPVGGRPTGLDEGLLEVTPVDAAAGDDAAVSILVDDRALHLPALDA